jgi:hypothetical protein
MKTFSTFSCTPYLSLEHETGSKYYQFNLRKVHPLGGSYLPLRCCFWVPARSNSMGFDELRNDQGKIQNRSAKINTAVASFYLPTSSFNVRILRLAQKIGANLKRQKSCFWTVRMEVKTTWIRVIIVQQERYGHHLHVESIPVWIVCLQLEIFSSEPSAPKWYFDKLHFPN